MKTRADEQKLTQRALALAVVLASIGLSAYKEARIQGAGLLIHPFLVPMFILGAIAGLSAIKTFPRDVLGAVAGFVGWYIVSTLQAGESTGEILKILASFMTVIACALCIQTHKDFWAAALGINVAAGFMTIKGLSAGLVAYTGYNPLDHIANKNAFSLYALPAVLLGGYVVLDKRAPKWLRLGLLINGLLIAFSIFSGANRSGWLGMLLISIALAGRGQRIRGLLLTGLLGGVVYVLLHFYGQTDVVEFRLEQTRAGYSSDERRENLLVTSMRIGYENPFFGVGPQNLPYILAYRTHAPEPKVDPHNVFGHVLGGSGVIAFLAFAWLGVVTWRKPRLKVPARSPASHAMQLLRMQIVLFVVRGMFTREILYNPSFAAGFGLCLGLCLIEYRAYARAQQAARAVAKAKADGTYVEPPTLPALTPAIP